MRSYSVHRYYNNPSIFYAKTQKTSTLWCRFRVTQHMIEYYFFSCRKRNVRAVNFYIHPNLNQPRIFLEHIFNLYDDSN